MGVVGSDRWSAYSRFPAERRALCYAHLERDFQALVDRGGEAEPIDRWGLAEIARLFALWHRFRAGEFGRPELQRRLVPLQARLGRLLRRGQENPDRKAGALCQQLRKWWPVLWTFARVEGVGPTNNVAERALRPAVLWRKGCFGADSAAGSRFGERLLTVVATCRQQGRRLLTGSGSGLSSRALVYRVAAHRARPPLRFLTWELNAYLRSKTLYATQVALALRQGWAHSSAHLSSTRPPPASAARGRLRPRVWPRQNLLAVAVAFGASASRALEEPMVSLCGDTARR